MDDRTLRLLEFPKILAKLADHCRTKAGREAALELRPDSDEQKIGTALVETQEARHLLSRAQGLLGGVKDCRLPIQRATRGGLLGADELLDVADTLRGLRMTRRAVVESETPLPRLSDVVWAIPGLSELEEVIFHAIDENGVRDEASPKLKGIRRRLRSTESQIRQRLDAAVRSSDFSRLLQEPIVSQRFGRWVVPVKVETRGQVPGIVHDTSQSGATLFVEPQWVVEMGNEVARIRGEESAEIERILQAISGQVGDEGARIEAGLVAAQSLDVILAKAGMAEEWRATAPGIAHGRYLRLKGARHPLLSGSVVPIDVTIGPGEKILVITGPNTGGKTVALKTVGLMAILFQSGFHVPVAEGSELPVFQEIVADIGDEQSIEQSLSTFSSHMTSIITILSKLLPLSLVLLDELGAGTDPAEGAALGAALLEELLERTVLGVVTTHYAEIKAMALTHPGLENAAVEFDMGTLSPTYRVLVGAPGRSQAFLIAKRLGLPERILTRAREVLPGQESRMEDLLAELDRRRRDMETALQTADENRRVADIRLQTAEATLASAREKADKLMDKAKEESQGLLQDARRELRQTVKEVRKARQETASQEGLDALRARLEHWEERLASSPVKRAPRAEGVSLELRRGQTIVVESLGQPGTVLEVSREKEEALVEVGMIRLWRPVEDLSPAEPEVAPQASGWTGIAKEKALAVSSEVNVVGLSIQEAMDLLDKYLDDATLAGLTRVRIVHGKGTGALRRAVHDALGHHPDVKAHRIADAYDGGAGATIAEL